MAPPTREGTIDFVYQGETFKTYFKLFGDMKTLSQTPLIVIHGGPGLTHDYLLNLAELSSKHAIPVILYDQLGNGLSTHLREKPSTFWSIDLFIDELSNLINYLGIQDKFDILGHSWGAILASEFEIRRQPHGFRRFISSNSHTAVSDWQKSVRQRTAVLPKEVQEGMQANFKDPLWFHTALTHFYPLHGCRVQPYPDEYMHSLRQIHGPHGDDTVISSGFLEGWSIGERLHLIRVRTLVINGRHDIAQDWVVKPLIDKIPDVKWIRMDNSSHSPNLEEPELYLQIVSDFLKS
ncbi:proline iminopeptidase [Hysterangium stoloniferum]|nr:proline iminopeptidase [Hysterangium stoloniferum]